MSARTYPVLFNRQLLAFCAVVAIHAALVYGWHVARTPFPAEVDGEGRAMQWISIKAAAPVPTDPAGPGAAGRPDPVRPAPHVLAKPGAAALAPAALPTTEMPAMPSLATPNAAEILQIARAEAGKIARDLRQEKRGLITAPPDSPALRMRRGIERAAELAPNKWYQEPKVEELVVAGGSGARRYRVRTGDGEYCVTYETNHALDGIDTMKDGIKPKFKTCPKYEQPATNQEW